MTPPVLFTAVLILVMFILFIQGRIRADMVALAGICTLGFAKSLGLDVIPSINTVWLGFGSNAVVTLVAVMLLAMGLESAGLMDKLSQLIVSRSKGRYKIALVLLMLSSGITSAVMQNAAVVALYLPVAIYIAARFNQPISRFAMPVAFAATAGGTMTLVSTAPMIMLPSLLPNSQNISFTATFWIGLLILVLVTLVQVFIGDRLLPNQPLKSKKSRGSCYGVKPELKGLYVARGSKYIGRPFGLFERQFDSVVAGYRDQGRWVYTPHRKQLIQEGMTLSLFCDDKVYALICSLPGMHKTVIAEDQLNKNVADFCEMLVPTGSMLDGKRVRDVAIRRHYGVAPVAILSRGTVRRLNLRAHTLKQGDMLLCFGAWQNIKESYSAAELMLVGDSPRLQNPAKISHAFIAFFIAVLGLIIGVPSALAFSFGVAWLALSNTLNVSDALRDVNWNTVALIGSMIAIGSAVQHSGLAVWLSSHLLSWFDGWPYPLLQVILIVLAMVMGMAITNLGAATVMVPLAAHIAESLGANPVLIGMAVALSVSNTFILPSSQVNMLVLRAGHYESRDFIKAGIPATLCYFIVIVAALYWYG